MYFIFFHFAQVDKPIQIGFTVLEFAKREIYTFLYMAMAHFGDKIRPLYTDTDSIMFHCKFDKPWEKFYNSPLRPLLDFDKVPDHWSTRTPGTNKISGLWSPEADGREIVEFVGLRSKTYCYRFADQQVVIKNKGVPKSAVIADEEREPVGEITLEHYKEALFAGKEHYVTQYAIRSKQHKVLTTQIYKLGVSGNDYKRTICADRQTTIPYGYKGEKYRDLVTDYDDPDNFQT